MISILVTCADEAEATRIADHVVEHRLAACAQIMPPHRSVYRWQGKIERAAETNLLIKTEDALYPAIRDAVTALHSYTVPAIIAWPATAVNEPYAQWLAGQVGLS